jgi:hypothetical protein
MADRIIASGDAHPIPREREPAVFFKLHGRYLIDTKSTTYELGDDIACLCESLIATLTAVTDVDSHEKQLSQGLAYTALYVAQQVSTIAAELVDRIGVVRGPAAGGEVPTVDSDADKIAKMGKAICDSADAFAGLRAALKEMNDGVYADCHHQTIGLFEAAWASAERLDRSMAMAIEAESAQ